MTATPEYYAEILESFPDTESLTVLVVAGASVAEVASALDLDLDSPEDPDEFLGDTERSGWQLLEVPGGVLAVEGSGFGDPTRATLAGLSSGGRSAAVARCNILAHERFGCARDGRLLFDDDEYMYVDDPSGVPADLRPLFDLAWDDLSDEDGDDEEDGPDGFAVALAMAEQVTGVALTSEQVESVVASDCYPGPTQQYAEELDG